MFLSREKLSGWRWRGDQTKFYIFFRLLLTANETDKPFGDLTIKRGQLPFSCRSLSEELSVSLQTLRTTLRHLCSTGDIRIESIHNQSVLTICEYDAWCECCERTGATPNVVHSAVSVGQNETNELQEQIARLTKENENLKKENSKRKDELDWRIVEPEFSTAFTQWIQYKKERKESYTPTGFKGCYTRLKNLSKNDGKVAQLIVEQSIANNWSGLFSIKDDIVRQQTYPRSVDDVKEFDYTPSIAYFKVWMEKSNYDIFNELKHFPSTEKEFRNLVDHTKGGAKTFNYVILVMNRDGWDDYFDERGFMFTYANYINANGLYVE